MKRTVALLAILTIALPAYAMAQHTDTPPAPFANSAAVKTGDTVRNGG